MMRRRFAEMHRGRSGSAKGLRLEGLRLPTEQDPFVRVFQFVFAAASLIMAAPAASAPFESARTIDGAAVQPQGHVTIVHYWASWCAPCRVEMPIFDAYYRKHRAQGLEMVAISLDQGVSTRKLHDLTAKYAFPVARIDDVKMARRDIPTALPVNRVYDKSGKLRFQEGGDGRSTIDMATLERVVSPLLAGR
jgi:thiol-disulfide isomerase/thioredoxin